MNPTMQEVFNFGLLVFFLLSKKNFFERKTFNSVVCVFFLFPETSHEAHICRAESLVACIIHMPGVSLLLGSQRWCVQIPLSVFFSYFQTHVNTIVLLISKISGSFDNFWELFDEQFFFLRNIRFPAKLIELFFFYFFQ